MGILIKDNNAIKREALSFSLMKAVNQICWFHCITYKKVQSPDVAKSICIIINAGMPCYDDVHHHLFIYDHTDPVNNIIL